MPLTDEQKNILVESIGKPTLVLAGPGTGKTELLAHKILDLLKENSVSKDEITAITFTTKAAQQMKKRLLELGLLVEKLPLICTLHSLSVKILREKGSEINIPEEFMIADEYESYLVLEDAICDVSPNVRSKIKQYSNEILLLKANSKYPNDVEDDLLKRVYKRYQELLRFHSALDFQDLILEAYRVLESSDEAKHCYQKRCKYLLIDEFQDMNKAEYSLVRLLADKGDGLFVVGDDKQSIYGWRGGDPDIILGFAQDFKGAIERPMTMCFRCPEKIIKGADEFIGRDPPLQAYRKSSEPIKIIDCKSDVQEARYICEWIKSAIRNKLYVPKDIAILFLGGDIADKIAAALTKAGIPLIRPSPEESKHMREIIACLRLIVDRRDSLALRVCLSSKLAKGIGPIAIKSLLKYAETIKCSLWDAVIVAQSNNAFRKWRKAIRAFVQLFEDLSATASKVKLNRLLNIVAQAFGYENEPKIIEMIEKSKQIPDGWSLYDFIEEIRGKRGEKSADLRESGEEEADAILFITMHSVKGLERKVVFVVGMEKGNFPRQHRDIEEQRRLFYVAMTRAKEELFLCHAKNRTGRSAQGYKFYGKSPFLYDIPQKYREFIIPNN